MQMQSLRLRVFAFVAGAVVLALSGTASADPPSRVARLGYMAGAVSLSPAGESDWVQATINRPLTTGDRLWADAGARAEIQVGGAWIRINAGTAVSVLNLDDRIAQLQLTQGTLNVRVNRLEPGQAFEVDTPNLAFTLRQPAEYRIEVDADGNATTIVVRKGQGEVYGEDAAYVIDSRQPYRFTGTGLREYQYVEAPRLDEFDRWSSDRDRRYDGSRSARYVSPDVIGYQDLDANGTWRVDTTYGNVWIPTRVSAGWAPYSDGHWAWVDPWGWTWVDDAPWGFAVSHYGRWANLGGTWGWVPGPVRTRAYYAPALVAFVGGDNFQLAISGGNVGGVAWFPLGPRDVYRPSYAVSRGYFENLNRSNTVLNTTVINNYYNNVNVTNVVYANRQIPGAVVAVPMTAFVQSQPVSKAAVRVSREMVVSGPVAVAPAAIPTEKSVHGAAAQGGKPPSRVFERPVVARTAPAAAHAGFAAQQQQLAAKPGAPLDDAARKELKPAAAVAPAPVVKIVAQPQKTPPTLRPPAAAAGPTPDQARGKSAERNAAAAPATAGAPSTPPQAGAPSPATPPVSAAQPPDQRGKAEQRGKGEQRGQPVVALPPTPQAAPQPQVAQPPATPAVSAAQPPDQRGKAEQRGPPGAAPPAPPQAVARPPVPTPPVSAAQPPEQRGKVEKRGQPDAPPPAPPQAVAQPSVAPPSTTPPVSAAQPPEQRGKPERGQPIAQPPQRTAEPKAVPQIAAPAPAATATPQPARPDPSPYTKPAEPRTPVAVLRPPLAQPLPQTEPRGPEPKPAAGKPNDKKKDGEESKREEETRKPKE